MSGSRFIRLFLDDVLLTISVDMLWHIGLLSAVRDR